jgi:hypothetical protein
MSDSYRDESAVSEELAQLRLALAERDAAIARANDERDAAIAERDAARAKAAVVPRLPPPPREFRDVSAALRCCAPLAIESRRRI